MGEKAKNKLKKFQKERAESRKNAREHGGLKFELYQAQGGLCLYGKQVIKDGKCVYLENGLPMPGTPGWDNLVIDHIVPREAPYNGPDATVNYVLTTSDANNAKRKRTPFDWFQQDRLAEWDGYKNFVTSKIGTLGGKKVQLLTRSDAAELVSKYTSLAETAWIAKLAQTLIRLHFGWPLEHERGKERVTVVPGGLTGRIRRKYLLNTLLDERFKNLPTSQIKPEDEEDAEKDRQDLRHHGLDAMLDQLSSQIGCGIHTKGISFASRSHLISHFRASETSTLSGSFSKHNWMKCCRKIFSWKKQSWPKLPTGVRSSRKKPQPIARRSNTKPPNFHLLNWLT